MEAIQMIKEMIKEEKTREETNSENLVLTY